MLKTLKSRDGSSAIMSVAIMLVLLLVFSSVMEYLRIYIIANGVRDAAISSINILATDNADKTYGFVREGQNNINADAEALKRINDFPYILSDTLGLNPEGDVVYRKLLENGATEYKIKNISLDFTRDPLIFTAKLNLIVPVRLAGEVVTETMIPLQVKSHYQEKY